jgi:secreted Zn-dependent insulinase-like peptidase
MLLFVTACSRQPDAVPQPVQSPNDDHQYRTLVLANQLQVLLISDPQTHKAAASMDVMVGSGDNPEGRGGLAHFLEHMLFLGTDKYPDAAEYEEYISEHGGSRNAYTSFEHTNYFFDVNAAFLPEALDRFAQFFISPRFDAQYVEREKNAVEAEFQMGLKSDPRRGLDVLQEIMNPRHPFSQFSVGTLDTLADRPGSAVRDELLDFYARHYSANVMRLVVLGSQSLDELEALVAPVFTPVPNRSFEHSTIAEPIFPDNGLPMLVQVQPQATQRLLEVTFPIADYRAAYRAKPVAYVGSLVGHEGEGSLFSQLKAEGLAESLGAGSGLSWRGGSFFTINITLTEKGVKEYQRVLQLLFAYMDMLRGQGPQQWLYQEQSQLGELHFRFKEDVEPISYVSALASGMHYYAPEDLLRGPYIMEDYEADELRRLMQRLVPDNALVILNDAGVETDRSSRFYGVPYSVQKVAPPQLAEWQSDLRADQLHLPAPNEFIADDVALVAIRKDNPAVPQVAHQSERQKIWFRQADEFRIPRGATYINFRSPMVGVQVEQTAAALLYTALLKDAVNEFAYPAALAGLNFDLYKHAQGISLRISGYTDKQEILLTRILGARTPTFDPQRFENIRKDMIRSLQNSVAKRPSGQVMDDLREALQYGDWGEEALIAALRKIDPGSLRRYAEDFWRTASAEAMVYGNYSEAAVQRLAGTLAPVLDDGPPAVLPDLRVLKLAAGESLQYAVDVPHDDSVVAWYLQGAGDSWKDRAATELTAQIIKSGFFQQLRTEQQLGYIVSAFSWPRLDVPGLVLLIQSPSASAPDVAAAIEAFMTRVEDGLDDEQFMRHREALMQEIRRPDKNLWERSEFYWQSIAKKEFDFDGRDAMAAAVEGFDRTAWLDYFRQVFIAQRRSLQVVAPGRWGELPPVAGEPLGSADEIKAGHDVFIID